MIALPHKVSMIAGYIFCVNIAFIIPQLAVATQAGFSGDFCLNLLFWLLSFGALELPLMAIMWLVAMGHAMHILITRKQVINYLHPRPSSLHRLRLSS